MARSRSHSDRITCTRWRLYGQVDSRSFQMPARLLLFPRNSAGRHLWRRSGSRRDAHRARIESMPKAKKGGRPKRLDRSVAVNEDTGLMTRDLIAAAGLHPRLKSETSVLKANLEELTRAVARSTEVFGDEESALRWLGTPVAALDYATPISCLGTHRGALRVDDVLTQIEHGVW